MNSGNATSGSTGGGSSGETPSSSTVADSSIDSSTAATGDGRDDAFEFGPFSLLGANLSSAEFGADVLPGVHGTQYIYPDPAYVPGYEGPSYLAAEGMSSFRLPFRWERLQPTLYADFDAEEWDRLTTTVDSLLGLGSIVVLDPHNYARYHGALIGSDEVPNDAFDDLWTRLAARYAGEPHVVFGLMNEPNTMPTEQWIDAANGAIQAIRAAGAPNLVLVPGNAWSNASAWSQDWYGTPNAEALLDIVDPGDNFAIEVHNYFNDDASNSDACISPTIGVERLEGVTAWLEEHELRGFVGEFSGNQADADCEAAVTGMLAHVHEHEVYLGWAWWAAGPWWNGTPFEWTTVEPIATGDNPKMQWLRPYLR